MQVGQPIGDQRVGTQIKIHQLANIWLMQEVVSLIHNDSMRQANRSSKRSQHGQKRIEVRDLFSVGDV
jgi:hypothetical protein